MRIDHDMAFMLQFENVAWFEDGKVRILDRRVYPREEVFVVCDTYQDVVKALQDMVTQSGGPYLAASMGMVLAAHQVKDKTKKEIIPFMKVAADAITNARPTTAAHMKTVTDANMEVVESGQWETGEELVALLKENAIDLISKRYARFEKIAQQIAEKVPMGGTIMTQCFGETVIGMLCRNLKEMGNDKAKFICPETRPYLQGARLTATVIHDMGFEVHVITDNMPGYILKEKKVDVFTSSADMITQDGHVVNKVGTFQIAMMCNYYGIPYFVSGFPSLKHETIDTVKIEERDATEVLEHLGTKVTAPGVEAFYPAFDITPPKFVSGVVTEKGIFSPYDLTSYLNKL